MGIKDVIEEQGYSATLIELKKTIEADMEQLDMTDESGRLLARDVQKTVGKIEEVCRRNNLDMMRRNLKTN